MLQTEAEFGYQELQRVHPYLWDDARAHVTVLSAEQRQDRAVAQITQA
jgi:hypothetical protein